MNRRILFCHCTYAKVVPEDVKKEVLRRLSEADVAFDAVADLCDLAARDDPSLARLAGAEGEDVRIAACFPRAVRWLFHGAKSPLPESARVLNMREESAESIVANLLAEAATTNGVSAAANSRPAHDATEPDPDKDTRNS